MHSVTDRRTDGRTDGQQDDANSRSYCVAVRSAKMIVQAWYLSRVQVSRYSIWYGKHCRCSYFTIQQNIYIVQSGRLLSELESRIWDAEGQTCRARAKSECFISSNCTCVQRQTFCSPVDDDDGDIFYFKAELAMDHFYACRRKTFYFFFF